MGDGDFLPIHKIVIPCLASGAAGIRKLFLVLFGLLNGLTDFCLDFFPASGVTFPRIFDDCSEVILWCRRDGKGGSREGWDLFPVDNHRDNEVAVVHLEEILSLEGGLKLFDENRSVVGGDTEGNGSTNVTKDSVADRFGHLGNVLVGNSKVETVFASLREDHGE